MFKVSHDACCFKVDRKNLLKYVGNNVSYMMRTKGRIWFPKLKFPKGWILLGKLIKRGEATLKKWDIFHQSLPSNYQYNDILFCFLLFPVYALDAKMRFDDNAGFRQKEIFDQRDLSQEDDKEVEASKHNLNYIALDGTVIYL